jgi:hypothetical protein
MTDAPRIRSSETWDAARDAYLAGATAEEVCDRHDLGLSAFRARARRFGWRRTDQPDPEPDDDDLDAYAGVDLPELVDLAWRRVARALDRGASTEAARWLRIHAALHARAQSEATEARREEDQIAHLEKVRPGEPPRLFPRLSPDGRDVHDVHPKIPDDAPLTRAERRRREREARRRR